MAKFPDPPASLAAIPPEWVVLSPGQLLWRVHFRAGSHPTRWNTFRNFGPTSSRFDHHTDPPRRQRRAILYGAQHGPTCVAEVFQNTRVIDRGLDEPHLVGFRLDHAVTLLDLTGTWPTQAGASMAINSGPRARSRLWSQRIYADYVQAQGLWYASSMNANQPAVALYERARSALVTLVFDRALADPALTSYLRQVAATFKYALV